MSGVDIQQLVFQLRPNRSQTLLSVDNGDNTVLSAVAHTSREQMSRQILDKDDFCKIGLFICWQQKILQFSTHFFFFRIRGVLNVRTENLETTDQRISVVQAWVRLSVYVEA